MKSMNIKRIGAAEFRSLGYLQEVNRQFLHPLGLALEVVVDEDGTERFGGVWDARDDPEGWVFGDALDAEKAERIEDERITKARYRQDRLGYVIQPVREDG